MPEKDGTGPKGEGPMTGKGGGKCIVPLNTEEDETKFLKIQKKALKNELQKLETDEKELIKHLKQVENRLKEIEK